MNPLPEIPGGWSTRNVSVGTRTFQLHLPADPDAMLDDPETIARNRVNDYMPYWAFLWPSAVPTAESLRFAPWPVGTRVLEVGCGLGLVGMAALARGDDVVFSDHDAICLEGVRRNVLLNGLPDPETLFLDWREPAHEKFPVIVGCEVTYDAAMHPVLLELLSTMLLPGGMCWLSDPGRFQAPKFLKLALERGFSVRILGRDGAVRTEASVQEFQIFELTRS